MKGKRWSRLQTFRTAIIDVGFCETGWAFRSQQTLSQDLSREHFAWQCCQSFWWGLHIQPQISKILFIYHFTTFHLFWWHLPFTRQLILPHVQPCFQCILCFHEKALASYTWKLFADFTMVLAHNAYLRKWRRTDEVDCLHTQVWSQDQRHLKFHGSRIRT